MEQTCLNSIITIDYIWIKYVGTYGKFQKWLTVYMWLVVGPLMACNMTTQLLLFLVPNYHCDLSSFHVAMNAGSNLTINDSSNATLTAFISSSNRFVSDGNCFMRQVNSSVRQTCVDGYVYDHGSIYSTPVSENDWVCDDSWKVYFIHSIYWAASAVGIIILGIISDHYGRVFASKICFLISGVAGICTIFTSHNFFAFSLSRAMMGFSAYQGIIPLVLVTEFVDINKRLMVSMGYFSSVSLTSALLPWFARLLHDWKLLSFITALLMFLVPVISFFIPESVRWLMAKGKIERAKENIQLVAQFNGQMVSGYILDNIQFFAKPNEPLRKIFKFRKFLKLFFLTCLMWFLVCLVFIGSNIYSSLLVKNPFFVITVNSLIDVIGTLISGRLAEKFGRKAVTCYSCFFCCIFYSASGLVPADEKIFYISFFLARFTLMMIFNIKLFYAAEVYPTVIRNRAVSLRMAIGSLGSFLSPAILSIRVFGPSSSLLVFGLSIGLSGMIMFFLPETRGKPLPETLQDAENRMMEEA